MTKLERVLSKRALAAVDAYRARHGIRTRRAAITEMVLRVSPEPDQPLPIARKPRKKPHTE